MLDPTKETKPILTEEEQNATDGRNKRSLKIVFSAMKQLK